MKCIFCEKELKFVEKLFSKWYDCYNHSTKVSYGYTDSELLYVNIRNENGFIEYHYLNNSTRISYKTMNPRVLIINSILKIDPD